MRSQEVHHTSEEQRDILQLGDVVLSVAAVFAEQRQVLQVLSAGVSRVQFGQFSEDDAPRPDLLQGVLDTRDGLPAVGVGGDYSFILIQTTFLTSNKPHLNMRESNEHTETDRRRVKVQDEHSADVNSDGGRTQILH